MREIKFRAWNKEKKEFSRNQSEVRLENNSEGVFHLHQKDGKVFGYYMNCGHIEISQFTGLLDKNGKEIYEGDILKMYIFDTSPIPLEIVTSVSFHEGTFTVLKMNNEPVSLRDAIVISNKTKQGVEIIGNIYENPELLSPSK